jgi:Tfp pilus assembly protein PilO
MKNLPKEKRDRLILIALGTIVIVVAVWQGLISWQNKHLLALDKQTKDLEAKVGNADRLIVSVPDLQKKLEAQSRKLDEIEDSMASGDLYSWMILTMNRFRANYKVEIPQFSREVTGEVGLLPKFPYRAAFFNVRGTAYYHDFGKFVADFENAFPFIRVQNVELEPAVSSSATSTGEAEKLTFRMEIVALINPNVSH